MQVQEKKTVLQIIDSLHRGGAQKVVLEIVKALPEFNHIVCYWENHNNLESEFKTLGVELIRMPFNGMKTLPRTISFMKKIKRNRKIHFIHSHMFVPNLLARFLKDNQNKTLCTYHGECFEDGGVKGFLIRFLERLMINKTDRLIAVSEYVNAYVKKKLGIKNEIRTIHNFGRYSGPVKLYKRSSTLKLVATSNNQKYKNYPLLLDAFEQLRGKPVSLDVYGAGMEPLIALAQKKGLEQVTFKGVVTDVSHVLANYDAYIATSDSGEGFSLSMLEAMSAGLAVICSDIPPFVEAVGEDGIVFRTNDCADLVKQINTVLLNPQLLERKSKAVWERSRRYSAQIFAEMIGTEYC